MVSRLPLTSGDFDMSVVHERAEVRYRRLGNAPFSLPLVSVELTTGNRVVPGLVACTDPFSLPMLSIELVSSGITVSVLVLCLEMGSGID